MNVEKNCTCGRLRNFIPSHLRDCPTWKKMEGGEYVKLFSPEEIKHAIEEELKDVFDEDGTLTGFSKFVIKRLLKE